MCLLLLTEMFPRVDDKPEFTIVRATEMNDVDYRGETINECGRRVCGPGVMPSKFQIESMPSISNGNFVQPLGLGTHLASKMRDGSKCMCCICIGIAMIRSNPFHSVPYRTVQTYTYCLYGC